MIPQGPGDRVSAGNSFARWWSGLPSRVRGGIASVGVATIVAMLTALGQQAQSGRYDLGLVLSVGLAAWCGAMSGFVHGLGLPQE